MKVFLFENQPVETICDINEIKEKYNRHLPILVNQYPILVIS